jgi:hypothetical protein
MKEYYCKLEDIKQYDDWKKFLKKFIKKNPKTYYVSSDNVQCSKGKNRSLTDVYYITKNRYLNLTEDEVYVEIMKIVYKINNKIIYFCSDINKCVVLNNCYYDDGTLFQNDIEEDADDAYRIADGLHPNRLFKLAEDAGILL